MAWRSCCWALAVLLLAYPATGQDASWRIRSGDSLTIVVEDQPAITNRYLVEPEGIVTLPLVGALRVEGLTEAQVTVELRRRLSEFLTNAEPLVTIVHARRVFVFGNVKTPGPLEMTGDTTLLEALSRSGYRGTSEIVVVRPKHANETGAPTLIDDPTADVIKVNLPDLEKELEAGTFSRNVLLRDGDTIYVPAQNRNEVYVSGAVRKPGAYSIPEGTTVLQALSLAGGVNEQGAAGRVRVVTLIDGEEQSTSAKLDDPLAPGVTVIVPEKIPLPAIQFGPATEEEKNRGRIHLGQAFSLRPAAAIRRIGYDSNALNTPGQPTGDFTVVAGPELEVALDLRRVRLSALGDVDFVYFREFASERSVNRFGSATADIEVVPRVHVKLGGTAAITRDRVNNEVDGRFRRHEQNLDAPVQWRAARRLELEVGGRDFDRQYDAGSTFEGIDLRDTLTEHIRSATGTARFLLTSVTSLVVSGGTATHRFARSPQRDADATEGSVGLEFKSGGLLSGEARIGYLEYLGLDPTAPDLRGPVGHADLFIQPADGTRFGLVLERTTGPSFQPSFPYAIIDRAGGSLQQRLSRRVDARLDTFRETYNYATFAGAVPGSSPGEVRETTQRYESELGVQIRELRIGFMATYVQRVSAEAIRQYNGLRLMANISYGALQARAQ